MNLQTYLMIKQAASTSEDVYRASMRALENSDRAADYKNQLDALQGKYDANLGEIDRLQNLVDNGDAERLRMIQDINSYNQQLSDANAKLKAQQERYDANESNWQNYMVAANEERDKAVADAIRRQQERYAANEANWQNYMVDAVKEQNRADAKNRNRASTIRRQAAALEDVTNRFSNARENARRALAAKDDQIANQAAMLADNDNAISRMRRNASIGGAVGGSLIGGGLGYAGSNWLSKKLGLQGPDVSKKRRIADILLRTGGTLGGAGVGGYGGYLLGQNI